MECIHSCKIGEESTWTMGFDDYDLQIFPTSKWEDFFKRKSDLQEKNAKIGFFDRIKKAMGKKFLKNEKNKEQPIMSKGIVYFDKKSLVDVFFSLGNLDIVFYIYELLCDQTNVLDYSIM